MARIKRPELFEQATSLGQLHTAFLEERKRGDTKGIDRVAPQDFEKQLDANLKKLQGELRSGRYRCLPIVRFHKKKKSGGLRPLGICALRDRIVQRALLDVLTPVYERQFLPCSYAYRPGRGVTDVIKAFQTHREKGFHWVYEADIEDCFGSVHPDLLSDEIDAVCGDVRMRRLILRFLNAGILENSVLVKEYLGLPQGSPISPLLANIYLHPFDQAMTDEGFVLLRYADDFLVMAKSEEDASQAGDIAEKMLKKRRLRPSPDKTRVCHLKDGLQFLGFLFDEKGKRPSDKSLQAIEARLYSLKGSCRRKEHDEVLHIFRQAIRGWRNYFRSFGSFTPPNEESALAATQIALEFGEQESAHRFLTSISTKTLPLHYQKIFDELAERGGVSVPKKVSKEKVVPSPSELGREKAKKEPLSEDVSKRIQQLRRRIRLDPDEEQTFVELAETYARCGQYSIARALLQDLQTRKQHKEAEQETIPRQQLKELTPQHTEVTERAAEKLDLFEQTLDVLKEETTKHEATTGLSEEARDLYLRYFRGRQGVMAKAQIRDDGRLMYQPMSCFFGESVLDRHLSGEETYAIFPIDEDGRAHFGVFDVDLTSKVFQAHMSNPNALERRLGQLHTWCLRVVGFFEALRIPVLLEDSGMKGRHIWFFLDEPMPVKRIRTFLRLALQQIEAPPDGICVEMFPDREHHLSKEPGQPVKLPLGVHPASGKRSFFFDIQNGAPFSSEDALSQIMTVSPPLLEEWLMEHGYAGGLVDLEQRFPTAATLMKSCVALRLLVEKLQNVRHLQHFERVTLLYSFGQLGDEGAEFLHAAIGLCYDYDPEVTNNFIRKKRPFPISCPRVIEKHGDLMKGGRCACSFQKKFKGEAYPTPLLHVMSERDLFGEEEGRESRPKKLSAPKAQQVDSKTRQERVELETLLKQFIELRRNLRGVQRSLDSVSDAMSNLFDERKVDSLETSHGLLTRVRRGDGWDWTLEL